MYGKSLGALKRLPACAACGIRALPSDASQYRKLGLKLLDIYKFSENEKMQLLEKPIEYQKVKSVYKRKKHGSEEWEYFHLYPELVELNDQADEEEECELCGPCWKDGVSDQKRPKYSIANGVDNGVLHRGLSDQQRRHFGS